MDQFNLFYLQSMSVSNFITCRDNALMLIGKDPLHFCYGKEKSEREFGIPPNHYCQRRRKWQRCILSMELSDTLSPTEETCSTHKVMRVYNTLYFYVFLELLTRRYNLVAVLRSDPC